MRDAVLDFFDVPEQHGGIRRDSKLVRGAVDVEPFFAGFLAGANFVADTLY